MNAWQPYTPSSAEPWDLKKVGHLFRRAAFGATSARMTQALDEGPDKTIERLLTGGPPDDDYEKTCEYMASERSLPAATPTRQLAAWWLYRLLRSPHPLREKLCLFWHNHFATSNAKVNNARQMVGQYRTIHEHALGSFRKLLHAITIDPAMLVWLDTVESKKGKPNENYARELMELFSLGIGHYTETDIREAAKAFTGYSIKSGRMAFLPREHDSNLKTVFRKKGNYKAADIVDLCLEKPACSKFIVSKLYRCLISETAVPKDDILDPLAKEYQDSGYDTGRIVSTILRSQHFFSKAAYRQRVKSPVEFAVGIVRAIGGNVGPLPLAESLEGLGQVLFEPPSVKGWDGGTAWLNAQTVLYRQNLALAMTSTEDRRFGARCDPAAVFRGDETIIDSMLSLFLQNDVPAASREKLTQHWKSTKNMKIPPFWTPDDVEKHRIRTLTHLVLSLPEYQLC